mmetsp:Transcript_66794/g.186369  ORF Transcript_66794/g.186369 Transcript_66794/m.186369 type:complete len:231 (+) Transcript_66794:810-1502(+)
MDSRRGRSGQQHSVIRSKTGLPGGRAHHLCIIYLGAYRAFHGIQEQAKRIRGAMVHFRYNAGCLRRVRDLVRDSTGRSNPLEATRRYSVCNRFSINACPQGSEIGKAHAGASRGSCDCQRYPYRRPCYGCGPLAAVVHHLHCCHSFPGALGRHRPRRQAIRLCSKIDVDATARVHPFWQQRSARYAGSSGGTPRVRAVVTPFRALGQRYHDGCAGWTASSYGEDRGRHWA